MSDLKTSSAGVAPLQKEGYPGNERLIGYARAISLKKVGGSGATSATEKNVSWSQRVIPAPF